MGSTFSTIQIRNTHLSKPEQLKDLFCKYFEKKGLVPSTEEDAQFSYWLAFSDESKWVTFGSVGYDLDKVNTDMTEIAKNLNTHCILTNIVDSDFCELHLFCPNEEKDVITAGQVYCEEMYPESNCEQWEPLLAEGKTWEQLTEICNGDYVFVEDVLCDIAPLLGMNLDNLTADYDCFEEASSSIPNVIELHFKKAQQSSAKKKASLNTVFKQVFGEALKPLGFVKIKGRHPYFVRLVGNEIIHVVACKAGNPYDKGFEIVGGVATVYRQYISLDKSPHDNSGWLKNNLYFQEKSHPLDFDPEFRTSIHIFYYYDDESVWKKGTYTPDGSRLRESILEATERSMKVTEEFMLPALNDVIDIDSCIDYIYKYNLSMHLYDDDQYFGTEHKDNFFNESLLYFKIGDYGQHLEERSEMLFATIANTIKMGKEAYYTNPEGRMQAYTQESFDEHYQKFKEEKPQRMTKYEHIYRKCHAKALEELERRKIANIDILRSYGIDI